MTGVTPWVTTTLGLTLLDHAGQQDGKLSQLVQPGLRRNPRRAHLLVSTVLGKHIPVDPATAIDAANRLARAVADLVDGDPDVFGMAETATGLGGCVAEALNAPLYLHTTRRRTDVPSYVEFEEGHSHATQHAVRPAPSAILDADRPLVIVDDETSTGATALAAIAELHRRNPRPQYILASLVDLRHDEHRAAANAIAHELDTRIDAVSLATGTAVLPPNLVDAVQALPPPRMNIGGERIGHRRRLRHPWPPSVPDGGRHGFLRSDVEAFQAALSRLVEDVDDRLDDRPVLVVGHEEFMHLPLRVASGLTHSGRAVRFQSTTRSPAYVHDIVGYPLRRGYRFRACEDDQSEPRFLYNVWPQHESGASTQIVLMVDAPADTAKLTGPDGIEDVLTGAGHDVLTVVVDGADANVYAATRPGHP